MGAPVGPVALARRRVIRIGGILNPARIANALVRKVIRLKRSETITMPIAVGKAALLGKNGDAPVVPCARADVHTKVSAEALNLNSNRWRVNGTQVGVMVTGGNEAVEGELSAVDPTWFVCLRDNHAPREKQRDATKGKVCGIRIHCARMSPAHRRAGVCWSECLGDFRFGFIVIQVELHGSLRQQPDRRIARCDGRRKRPSLCMSQLVALSNR